MEIPYVTFESFSTSLMSQDKLINFHMGKLKELLHTIHQEHHSFTAPPKYTST